MTTHVKQPCSRCGGPGMGDGHELGDDGRDLGPCVRCDGTSWENVRIPWRTDLQRVRNAGELATALEVEGNAAARQSEAAYGNGCERDVIHHAALAMAFLQAAEALRAVVAPEAGWVPQRATRAAALPA